MLGLHRRRKANIHSRWNISIRRCKNRNVDLFRLVSSGKPARARILVQVTINRRLLIGQDGYLDQSEAYDLS